MSYVAVVQLAPVVQGKRTQDVSPEIKLKTLVSIASRAGSAKALELASAYTESVIEFWHDQWADFTEAVAVLRIIDSSNWPPLRSSNLHTRLKGAILDELGNDAGSSDIAAVVRYADGQVPTWNKADQTKLNKSFEHYFESRYSEELGDCSDISDLENMANALEMIGAMCGHDTSEYQREIEERVSELTAPDEDDDRPAQRWEGERGAPMSERMEEIEVGRLFDGLR